MSTKTKKILVVEANLTIKDMLVSQLKQELGIDVSSATTMAEAKHLIENAPKSYFLAILDLHLADAPDGEIVDFMLSKGIPSIVLTSNNNEKIQHEVITKGVIELANKSNPSDIRYVIDSSRRLLENFTRKVLVVDDSEVARMLIVALLEKQNLKVYEAINGVQALKLLKIHKDISLVVTDYNMPKMDGMELIYNIRLEHSRDELAIIGISSTDNNIVSVNLLKSGANDFITRPFSHEEFYCRINQNIDSVVNYKKLKDASITDFLTGLYNRKYIFDAGTKLFNNALRDNIKLTTAMIDIDFFKRVNDVHGHHTGDLALKHISKLLSKELRDGDILARMGGEEFCVLCINLDTEHAAMVFERIRKSIQDTPLIVDNLTLPITVSIGYNPSLGESLDQMINAADSALYQAKETGRNKVVIAGQS
ncbi:MAG: diguanylate cyclase [Gammaproteobacteria bacterium]|nr:diguanylate cyclase [Gammaproteobacteria bacterium]